MPQAQQLGRYQLLDRIAFGGMAEIYRAKTFDADGRARLVAVKRVLPHLTADEDFIRMLVDEARVTAILDHPAIARVYEFSQDGDEYFIAMEYVDGKDVRALLEKHRAAKTPMAPEHVAWIMANVAEGLHCAHAQHDADGRSLQIVHRDVSPSNMLVAYQGDVKLCDFGIAKTVLTRVQTRTGVIKGKVKYMSPEQAMGRKLDARSDLFSLGTVMFEMLTLEAPFIAATEVELIFAVRDAKRRDARDLVPSIPDALNRILKRVMERQRTDRYQSGREMARDLYAFLEKHSPGYRRAQCARYMRATFGEEIEKELRQLESWVIEPGDASKLGVNLIEDALPQNAPFRGFSAAASQPGLPPRHAPSDADDELPASPTGLYQREEHGPLPTDLHADRTYILGAEAARALVGSRADLHAQSTLMLDGREAEALHARLRAGGAPASPLAPRPGSIHEQSTALFDNPPVMEPVTPAGATDLPEQSTRILHTGLPAMSTQILQRDDPRAAVPRVPPPPAPQRPKQDTAPDPSPRAFVDESRETTLPRARYPEKVLLDDEDSTGENPLADRDVEET